MKAVVYVLALFAAAKIGTSEYLFRASARDVIVAAYRDRAIQACQRDTKLQAPGGEAVSWSRATDIRLSVGKSGFDVHLWQVDHHLWNARYRNLYLVLSLTNEKAAGLVCEYDVVHNAAQINRM